MILPHGSGAETESGAWVETRGRHRQSSWRVFLCLQTSAGRGDVVSLGSAQRLQLSVLCVGQG